MLNLLLILAITIILFLGTILAWLVFAYQKLLDKVNLTEETKKKLADASQKSEALFDDLSGQINSLVAGVSASNQKLAEYEGRLFKDTLEKLRIKLESQLETSSAALAKNSEEYFAKLQKAADMAVAGYEAELKEQLRKQYLNTNMYIEKYKKTSVFEIDQRVAGSVREIIRKVLGKAISEGDQEKILLKAIQDAKQKLNF